MSTIESRLNVSQGEVIQGLRVSISLGFHPVSGEMFIAPNAAPSWLVRRSGPLLEQYKSSLVPPPNGVSAQVAFGVYRHFILTE